MARFRFPLLLVVLSLSLVLVGCDSIGAGDDTITLSSETNDEFNPIEYTFQYSRSDVENGTISVTSRPNDGQDIDEPLDRIAAASRSDIQSAKVTKVTFRRVSSGGSSAETSKVFDYLSKAEVRLGTRSGPLVAVEEGISSAGGNSAIDMELGPEADASSVTDVLKNGDRPTSVAFNLDVQNPDDIGDPFDEIEIEIFYSITVR